MKRCLLMLCLLLIALPVQAQDDNRYPAPIDPGFTDAVQIVSTRPQIAYNANSFLVWNGTSWDEYSFPAALPTGSYDYFFGGWQPGGTYQVIYRPMDLYWIATTESDWG